MAVLNLDKQQEDDLLTEFDSNSQHNQMGRWRGAWASVRHHLGKIDEEEELCLAINIEKNMNSYWFLVADKEYCHV